MKQSGVAARAAVVLAAMMGSLFAAAPGNAQQGHPTASEALQLSAFGGFTGTYTELKGGRNLGIDMGVDLALPPVGLLLRPVVEVRGLFPIADGGVVSQRDVLAGVRLDVLLGHKFHPYGDFLIGRGQMNYNPPYLFNNFEYLLTTTNVLSPGLGLDYDLSKRFAVKIDAQYQRWSNVPTPSGTIYSKVGTVGMVYRFDFNGHKRRR